jgi:hypothetical protein
MELLLISFGFAIIAVVPAYVVVKASKYLKSRGSKNPKPKPERKADEPIRFGEAEPLEKRFARWIFILQTFMILVVPIIALLLVPPELFEQLEWSSLSEIAKGKLPSQAIEEVTDSVPSKVKLALALVSLRTFAGWLVFLFQYLFFGAYGFGWGAKK